MGETLINETRIFKVWADVLGVTPLTLMATMGAAISRGGDHRDGFAMVGRPDWQKHQPEFADRLGGLKPIDLYPDALPAIDGLRKAGYRIAVVANQPARRTGELAALGVVAEVIAMSDELGAAKPASEFFTRALELMRADPADVAYVGDRVDNDVLPSLAAGMHAIWLRRGPWAMIGSLPEDSGAIVVQSLLELVDRFDEVWTGPA